MNCWKKKNWDQEFFKAICYLEATTSRLLLSLVESLILGYSDYTLKLILHVDASAKKSGAVHEPLPQQKVNAIAPSLSFWLLNDQFVIISETTCTTPHILKYALIITQSPISPPQPDWLQLDRDGWTS